MSLPRPEAVREIVDSFPPLIWRHDGTIETCPWPRITRDTWCATHGIPHTDRPDPLALLCEPWLDSPFTDADDARTQAQLAALGIAPDEVAALRARLEDPLRAYNALVWDSFHLGYFDVVEATDDRSFADALLDRAWRHQGPVAPMPRVGDDPISDLAEAFAAAAGPVTAGWSARRDALQARILAAYAEPWRHFHTARHLAEAWALGRASLRGRGDADLERRLAWTVLFHDVVYRPGRADNEAESARLCEDAMRAAGEGPAAIEEVAHAIRWSARHDRATATTPLLRAFWDADMGILGLDPARYDRYAADVTAEYVGHTAGESAAVAPGGLMAPEAFRRGRLAFVTAALASLGDPVFFGLHPLHGEQARANLSRERSRLAG